MVASVRLFTARGEAMPLCRGRDLNGWWLFRMGDGSSCALPRRPCWRCDRSTGCSQTCSSPSSAILCAPSCSPLLCTQSCVHCIWKSCAFLCAPSCSPFPCTQSCGPCIWKSALRRSAAWYQIWDICKLWKLLYFYVTCQQTVATQGQQGLALDQVRQQEVERRLGTWVENQPCGMLMNTCTLSRMPILHALERGGGDVQLLGDQVIQ